MAEFNYLKSENKKLFSIAFVLLGGFFIIEHIYTYGGIELGDLLGHEWFGFLFIIIGMLIANQGWKQELTPFQYAWEKIKYIFKKK